MANWIDPISYYSNKCNQILFDLIFLTLTLRRRNAFGLMLLTAMTSLISIVWNFLRASIYPLLKCFSFDCFIIWRWNPFFFFLFLRFLLERFTFSQCSRLFCFVSRLVHDSNSCSRFFSISWFGRETIGCRVYGPYSRYTFKSPINRCRRVYWTWEKKNVRNMDVFVGWLPRDYF